MNQVNTLEEFHILQAQACDLHTPIVIDLDTEDDHFADHIFLTLTRTVIMAQFNNPLAYPTIFVIGDDNEFTKELLLKTLKEEHPETFINVSCINKLSEARTTLSANDAYIKGPEMERAIAVCGHHGAGTLGAKEQLLRMTLAQQASNLHIADIGSRSNLDIPKVVINDHSLSEDLKGALKLLMLHQNIDAHLASEISDQFPIEEIAEMFGGSDVHEFGITHIIRTIHDLHDEVLKLDTFTQLEEKIYYTPRDSLKKLDHGKHSIRPCQAIRNMRIRQRQ